MSQFQRHTDHDVDRSDTRLELSSVVSQLQRRQELTRQTPMSAGLTDHLISKDIPQFQ